MGLSLSVLLLTLTPYPTKHIFLSGNEFASIFAFKSRSGSKSFVSNLRDYGGGDDPERAYDAISLALLSNWSTNTDIRKVIILWTDVASHPLSGRIPEATNFDELSTLWNTKLQRNSKRLILFAPLHPTWTAIETNWENATRHDVTTGGGLTDVDYDEILRTLSESI